MVCTVLSVVAVWSFYEPDRFLFRISSLPITPVILSSKVIGKASENACIMLPVERQFFNQIVEVFGVFFRGEDVCLVPGKTHLIQVRN